MKLFSRLSRLIQINWILIRYNIDALVLGQHWFLPLRVLAYANPYYWLLKDKFTRAERIRMAIEALGPIFVKAGQIASTRRDILPDDIATELAKLQDRVPPFSGKLAIKLIEKALGFPTSLAFTDVDKKALASASIAQVHAAKLLSGDEVVIKVLRPNIEQQIANDVDLLRFLARLAERYWFRAKHLKPLELVNEVAQTLFDELDLMREGANASQLKRNFTNSPDLYVPKVYWEYTRNSILVLERIYGIPIHDMERLKQAGVNLAKLAEHCIEVFFTQIFRDSYFHADLHPGNIFVDITDKDRPSLITVDFGIVGSLNQKDQRYIAENMIAFFKRDYQQVAELHVASGWLAPDTRIDQFEAAIRAVSEPIFEQPKQDISFGKLLLRLFQVARRFEINIQPQLVLLQKTLLSIEGLCRQLAPDLDIWSLGAPQIEKWLYKQVGFKAFLKRVRGQFPLWSQQLPEMPSLLYEVLTEAKQYQEMRRFNRERRDPYAKQAVRRNKITYFYLGIITSAIIFGVGYWFS